MKINKIYNEDCLITMKRMRLNYIDLVVTSPPYDNLRSYKGYSLDFKKIADELFRVVKIGGVVVWVAGDATIKGSETGTSFKQALYFKEIGFNLHDTMIYQKKSPLPMNHKNRYNQCFEYMFIFTKGAPKTINIIQVQTKTPGRIYRVNRNNNTSNGKGAIMTQDKYYKTKPTKNKNNIWIIASVNGTEYIGHPAQFPESLANDHIITWSNKGDIVFDPFAGSGTTLKMALINERKFIGSEISNEYCKLIKKRLRNL